MEKKNQKKVEVYKEVWRQLKEADHPVVHELGFDDQLWTHFNRLPARYAKDVNAERAEDLLMHKRLLHLARDPANRLAFDIQLLQVVPLFKGSIAGDSPTRGSRPMHEITLSTVDKPKILTQLSTLLDEVGLNIEEAHAFSTVDGYILCVFVVDGWPFEEVEQLRSAVARQVSTLI